MRLFCLKPKYASTQFLSPVYARFAIHAIISQSPLKPSKPLKVLRLSPANKLGPQTEWCCKKVTLVENKSVVNNYCIDCFLFNILVEIIECKTLTNTIFQMSTFRVPLFGFVFFRCFRLSSS